MEGNGRLFYYFVQEKRPAQLLIRLRLAFIPSEQVEDLFFINENQVLLKAFGIGLCIIPRSIHSHDNATHVPFSVLCLFRPAIRGVFHQQVVKQTARWMIQKELSNFFGNWIFGFLNIRNPEGVIWQEARAPLICKKEFLKRLDTSEGEQSDNFRSRKNIFLFYFEHGL